MARRQGARSLPASTWTHLLSLELGWMTPGQARRYVEAAKAAGLLEEDGAALRLSVDPRDYDAQLGFRPDPEKMPESSPSSRPRGNKDPFVAWVERVAATTGQSRAAVLAQVADRQQTMGGLLTAEVAVLWVARDAGLDVRVGLEDAIERLRPHPSDG